MKKRLPILKEQLTDNWLYKLVSLTVALSIWATTLHGRKDTILLRNMDLEFVLKPNFGVTNLTDRTVHVKLSGPRNILKKFSQSQQTITLNLSNEEAGEKKVNIHPSDINLPV